jgi:hypothetical protein
MNPTERRTVSENAAITAVSSCGATVVANPWLCWQNRKALDLPFHPLKHSTSGFKANFVGFGLTTGASVFINEALRSHVVLAGKPLNYQTELTASFVSGVFSSLLMTPTEVCALNQNIWQEKAAKEARIRVCGTRTQQWKETSKSPMVVMRKIITEQGLKGVWRGGVPTLLRDGISMGSVLGLGPIISKTLVRDYGIEQKRAAVGASLIAGSVAIALTQGLQVSRVRLQEDVSKTWREVIVDVKKTHGYRGFYRGGLLRLPVVAGQIFCHTLAEAHVPKWINRE